ncbi:Rho GTPase [Yamadazyma tenuis]|uniref:Ras-domain-containing protein n=1 Tax=Candida tenuis (strain ATCC 10573 / BCRC 21748 / CBS 615 / JCM 9827 / NBRC 10315 / NRRL Y-1498 / VKM Y-70) TaxID=590646 RepID=G3B3K1_CANTC|nr:ras-domain-containing protein [Yamadazyma tenuis ATCC 10573]XP_006686728.1 uncharacterized protein CANTEDRAFT_114237 [Yamadazyma tenuis ATCC 10573]EGV64413.1 ras-domain-containing protein [Yamadazyma tenuis ATCC 10573]EGV64414.1 hypothetical protein CANTEDRAFT_114237 [Yamadazyma tenuis ATCC 10573]WEJ96171.1 Rho GTPase [Yamadazyma tenuis]
MSTPIIINDNPSIPHYSIQSTFKKSSCSSKIVVVGDGGCGKTCLLVSYTQQKFPEIYVPTIFENYVATVHSPSGRPIELALWDTAGQEEYDRLRPLSYHDVDVLLICFSLDNLTSLQNVKDIWFPEVNHFCPGIPILLVGTKADLTNGSIDPDLPIQLAYEINAIGYIQCSAKSMFNVATVFDFAIDHYLTKYEAWEKDQQSKKRLSFLGHSRGASRSSAGSKGHFKNSSIDSSVFHMPLAEEESRNPYTTNPYTSTQRYDNTEFEYATRETKKRRCTIL